MTRRPRPVFYSRLGCLVGALFLLIHPTASAQGLPQDLPEIARRQIDGLRADKASRTAAQRKIASRLLYAARLRQGRPPADGVVVRQATLDVDPLDRVLVDISGAVTVAMRNAILAVGGVVVDELPQFRTLRAQVPFAALEQLASRGDVERVKQADKPVVRQVHAASVNSSEGDVAHQSSRARATWGISGAGIKIGVLSDGVDSLSARQATGDVPAVTVLAGQAGSGDEGTAMLEIVHDLAPDASLYFATAGGGTARFAANILALCDAGVNVIVDDIGYAGDAVFEDGVVAGAVNTVTANGCHYFSAAGNAGNFNDGTSGVWEGDFVAGASTADGTRHLFGGSSSNLIVADPPSFITLQWSDKWGAAANDYDLYLFDNSFTTVLDFSTDVQSGAGDPLEAIDSEAFNDVNNRLVIVRWSGASRFLHLNANEGGLLIGTPGQIFGHPAAALAYAVGASDVSTAGGGAFTGGSANPIEWFSSDGPRRMFYSATGAALTPGNFSSTGGVVRQKPEIVAADGVSTSTPGFETFFGTSAAVSHAAAIAALVLEAAGGANALSVAGLRNVLLGATLDIEASGVDRDSGHGIVDAYRGVPAVLPVHEPFDDEPLLSGVHTVRAVHINQLRTRIDAARTRYGLAAHAWTDPTIVAGVTVVKAVHIQEMRVALSAAYTASGRAAPTFTDPTLPGVPIKATHVNELRSAVTSLP